MSIKKFCPWSNCNQTIDISQRYCDKHTKDYEAMQAQRQSKYDKTVRLVRDKQYRSFYVSDEWGKVRAVVNQRYKGMCLYSYLIDKEIVQVDVIHHIVELKDDWGLRLNIDNLIPLSHKIHNRIGMQYKDNKEEAQEFLRGLLKRWKEEMNPPGV